MIKQKTIRFYDESNDDRAAYEKLGRFREYGFNNSREFVIRAINEYMPEKPSSKIDVDDLARRIAERLSRSNIIVQATAGEDAEDVADSEAFDKALAFINNL